MPRRSPLAATMFAALGLAAAPAGADAPPPREPAMPPAERGLHTPVEPAPAPAAPSPLDAWLAQPTVLGDWGGLRPWLLQRGVTFSLTFVTDVLGNPIGGERRKLQEFDNLGLDVGFDLGRIAGLRDLLLHVSVSQRSGRDLSSDAIGNVFPVAEVCCGPTFRLVNVDLEQRWLDGRVSLRVGRFAAGDEFLTSAVYWPYVQAGIDGNPYGIFLDAPGFTAYPVAAWGARVRVAPDPAFYGMVGLFDGSPALGENAKHGVDLSLRGPVFAIAEAGYRRNPEPTDPGLPGEAKLGGWFNGGDFEDFVRDDRGGIAAVTGAPPKTTRGNAGFYLLLDQMVTREGGPGTAQGLTPFLSVLVAPDAHVNALPFFVNGGLVYRGLIPNRDHDTAALGVVYGRFSDELRRAQRIEAGLGVSSGIQEYELVLEATYALQVAPGLVLQPDVQYVVRPGGTGRIPDALVLGLQLAVSF